MDYIFFSALKDNGLKNFNVSYDIVCQWSRHLWERMKTLPPALHFHHVDNVEVLLYVIRLTTLSLCQLCFTYISFALHYISIYLIW